MSIATEAADLLEKAADLIETGHHLRDTLGDGEGGYCAAGAINQARTGAYTYPFWAWGFHTWGDEHQLLNEADAVVLAAHATVAAHLNLRFSGQRKAMDAVVDWNNRAGRIGAEVVDAFRHAAKNLRNEAVPA